MRAGLLSEPQVIATINQRFVSTTITYVDLLEITKKGDTFAGEVAVQWSNPVTLMFLSSEGKYLSKLSVLEELNGIHPDTTFRPGQRHDASPERNLRGFLKHVHEHFSASP